MTALLSFVGRSTLGFLSYLGGLTRLGRDAAWWTVVAPAKGKGLKWPAAVHQMVLTGIDSIPIVSLISFFIGLILALQGAYALRRFGATTYVVDMVAISMTRELGPLMTAIIVAGRSGSAFTAEIGTMKVSEEIDALETMGLNRIKFLVVPKYLALLLMMPCLTTLADTMGILGGALFTFSELDMPLGYYLLRVSDALVLKDINTGLIKSVVFGMVISAVGCYEGFAVTGGAEGVGKSTTRSVVISIFTIIAADMFFSALFYYFW